MYLTSFWHLNPPSPSVALRVRTRTSDLYSLYMAYAGLSGLGYPDVLLTHEIEVIARSIRAGRPRARPLPRGPPLHCL